MARLVIIGDIEVIMSRGKGKLDVETLKNTIVFECESSEELTELARNRGSVIVQFAHSEAASPAKAQPALL